LPWERRRDGRCSKSSTALGNGLTGVPPFGQQFALHANFILILHFSAAGVDLGRSSKPCIRFALVATLLPLGALGEDRGHEPNLSRLVLLLFHAWRRWVGRRCGWVSYRTSGRGARRWQGLSASGPQEREQPRGLARYPRPDGWARLSGIKSAGSVSPPLYLGPTSPPAFLALGPWPWLFAIIFPFGLLRQSDRLKRRWPAGRCVPKHAFRFSGGGYSGRRASRPFYHRASAAPTEWRAAGPGDHRAGRRGGRDGASS